MPRTTGIRQAAVPVLDRTEDKPAPTIMIPNIKLFSLVPENLTIEIPIFCARPVWNMAAPTTNIPAKSTTVESERPEKTCLAGIKPKRPQAIAPLIAVIAKGISSVINNRATIANTIKHLIAGAINSPHFPK